MQVRTNLRLAGNIVFCGCCERNGEIYRGGTYYEENPINSVRTVYGCVPFGGCKTAFVINEADYHVKTTAPLGIRLQRDIDHQPRHY